MPALSTVTFTSTDADSYEPVEQPNGIWNLICPDSPETIAADTTSLIEMHYTITIPVGYTGIITPNGTSIVGAANCTVLPQILRGTGSPLALFLRLANPSGGDETPTANNVIANLIIIKSSEYKHVQSGTWA